MLTWADRTRLEGALAAERDLLLRLLHTRFGDLPQVVTREINQADHETLVRLADRMVQVPTLDEFIAAL